MEVTGLILGVIPLVISALEHYGDGMRTIRRLWKYKWELKSLILELQTENIIFRNICEMMLDGLIESASLERLLKTPGGVCWKDPSLQSQLERRLDLAYPVYLDRVLAMEEAVKDFKARLGMDDSGKTPWAEKSNLKRAWKAGKLNHSKAAYDELIRKLRYNNQALQQLTDQSTRLYKTRQKRGQAQRSRLLRNYAIELYNALQALQCACKGQHTVALQIAP
jgi:hypothetical protein